MRKSAKAFPAECGWFGWPALPVQLAVEVGEVVVELEVLARRVEARAVVMPHTGVTTDGDGRQATEDARGILRPERACIEVQVLAAETRFVVAPAGAQFIECIRSEDVGLRERYIALGI